MNHVLINLIEEEIDICEEIAYLTNTYTKVCEITMSRKRMDCETGTIQHHF